MSELFGLLFDWPLMSAEIGLDGVLYAILALTGTTLFVVRFAMAMLGFGGEDDVEAGGEHSDGMQIFSLLSVTAFMMGSGWMGLTCRIDWKLAATPSAFVAGAFGLGLMMFASLLLLGMRRLGQNVTYDTATAIGRTGTAYSNIPARGLGTGQVRITVSGRSMVLPAGSTGEAIEAFAAVQVVSVRDDQVLLVKRAPEPPSED